jgi:signal transduction histidine kinase
VSARAGAVPSATANLTRVFCLAIAGAAVIFGGLSVGSFLAQGWHPVAVLAAAGWLASFGLPVLLGLTSRWASRRLQHTLVALEAVSFVVLAGYWLMAGPGPLPHGAEIPWVITFTGVPCMAVAVFAPGRVVWAFTVLTSLLSGAVRFRTTTEEFPALVGLADGLYSLLLVSVFVALTLAARRAAARVDDATQLARQAEAHRAARVSRRQERLRIDALVHDSVISTLLMAGLGRSPLPVVSAHAAKTLRQLDALTAPPVQPVVLVSDLVRRLSRLAAQIAPDVAVQVVDPACPGGGAAIERTVPSVAVVALLGAAGEALRNSVANAAGPATPGVPVRRVHRSVTVLSSNDGCQITVSDDGVGFTPGAVPPERLGIAQSILGRMEAVPGGVANVRSALGRGTDVVLAWAPERLIIAPGRPTPSTGPGLPAASTGSAAPVAERRRVLRRTEAEPPEPEEPAGLAQSLSLSGPAARSILALFVLVHGLLAAIDLVPHRPMLLAVVAYLAILAAAVALMTHRGGPFPRRRVLLILALCGVGAVLMFLYLPLNSGAPFAHWHLGAITLILVVLAIRGQTGLAWLGYAALTGLAVGWAVATDQPVLAGVELVSRHAGTLLAGTLFVVNLRRTERTLRVLTRDDTARAADDATTVAAITEREAELARVNALARPTLQRLAGGEPLSTDERAQCLLVEASLRDAIRGRVLFVEPVISAVTAARQRGVEVTVIDDSAETPPAALAALADTVAEVISTVNTGRITIRVLPAGRPDVATLVIDSGTPRLLSVTPAGTLA